MVNVPNNSKTNGENHELQANTMVYILKETFEMSLNRWYVIQGKTLVVIVIFPMGKWLVFFHSFITLPPWNMHHF